MFWLLLRAEKELEFERTFSHRGKEYIRAGITRRQIGDRTDNVIVICVLGLIAYLELHTTVLLCLMVAFVLGYYVFFLKRYQRTPGDFLWGMQTISLGKNDMLTVPQIMKRVVFHILLFPTMLFRIAFVRTQKKPFLADKLSKTEVVQFKKNENR